MGKEQLQSSEQGSEILRFDFDAVNASLLSVEEDWERIDDELDALGIGRKDTPFDSRLRTNMMSAYQHLDELLESGVEPFAPGTIQEMLVLNNHVHYGDDKKLLQEYSSAIDATWDKMRVQSKPIAKWYGKHKHTRGDDPRKIAAEVYVSILGQPQLFIEGNHRTGSIIASWINMYHGYPPFVLSRDNAIAYFAPSAEIKKFADKSTWRGKRKLPKYRKSFLRFWEENIDEQFVV